MHRRSFLKWLSAALGGAYLGAQATLGEMKPYQPPREVRIEEPLSASGYSGFPGPTCATGMTFSALGYWEEER